MNIPNQTKRTDNGTHFLKWDLWLVSVPIRAIPVVAKQRIFSFSLSDRINYKYFWAFSFFFWITIYFFSRPLTLIIYNQIALLLYFNWNDGKAHEEKDWYHRQGCHTRLSREFTCYIVSSRYQNNCTSDLNAQWPFKFLIYLTLVVKYQG